MGTRGRHRSGTVKTHAWALAGLLSFTAGIPVGIAAGIELFRYSPYEDRGALDISIRLGISAVLMMGIPVMILLLRVSVRLLREYRAWKRTLTPAQRIAVTMAEFGVMEGAHLALKHHHEKVSAELTASVMGPDREPIRPFGG